MKLIRPTVIGVAQLISSSVPEDTYAAWSSTVSYPLGATIYSATSHRRYTSAIPSNLNHDPAISPTQWTDIGPTNRWAMFDDGVGTLTEAAGSLTVQIKPGSIDALALVDLDAEVVTVTMSRPGKPDYTLEQSTNLGGSAINSWYKWFFEPLGRRTVLTFLNLPLYPDATITIVMTASDPVAGAVSCGTLIVGRALDIGLTEASPTASINDFSKKTTDDFGNTTVVERAWAKTMEVKCQLPTGAVDALQRELAKVRAKPCLWFEEGFDSLTVYGFFKSFSLDLAYTNVSFCSLTVEGLT